MRPSPPPDAVTQAMSVRVVGTIILFITEIKRNENETKTKTETENETDTETETIPVKLKGE